MTITEIASHLGVDVRHVRRLVAERRIPYLKWGHLLRFDPAAIDSWLHDVTVQPIRWQPSRPSRRFSGGLEVARLLPEVVVD